MVLSKRQENPSTSCWEIKEPSIGKWARVGQENTLKSFQFGVSSIKRRLHPPAAYVAHQAPIANKGPQHGKPPKERKKIIVIRHLQSNPSLKPHAWKEKIIVRQWLVASGLEALVVAALYERRGG